MTRLNSVLALAAGLALAPTAAAMDSQTCKQFVSGSWTSKPGDGGKPMVTTYEPGGTYSQGPQADAANAPNDPVESGSWDARDGKSDKSCLLVLTPTGEKPAEFEITIIDDNTIADPAGAQSTRFEGTMEEHTAP